MTIAIANILRSIEECALGLIGTGEVVTAGAFERGAYDEIPDPKLAHDALVKARVEAIWKSTRDTTATGRGSPHQTVEFKVLVRCVFTTDLEVDADRRRDRRVAAVLAAEQLRNALSHRGNLVTTQAGLATGITDGVLLAPELDVVREDFPHRIIVIEIRATGRACAQRTG